MRVACFHWLMSAALFGVALQSLRADPVPREKPAAPPKLDAHGDPLPPGAYARLGTTRLRHDAIAVGFVDAKTLVSVGSTICVWDIATGKLLKEHKHEKLPGAMNAAVSANGRVVVTAHSREEYRVWDTGNGKLIREFIGGIAERPFANIEHGRLSISADGKKFASFCEITTAIRVWSVEGSAPPVRLEVPAKRSVQCIALSPDGKYVATGLEPDEEDMKAGPELALWDAVSGKLLRNDDVKLGVLYSVAFSADSSAVVVSGDMGQAMLVASNGREIWRQRKDEGSAFQVYCAPDLRSVVIAVCRKHLFGDEIRVADGATGKVQRSWLANATYQFAASDVSARNPGGAISSDSKLFAMTGTGRLQLWSLRDGKELNVAPGHSHAICTTCISPDGRYIASTDFQDNEVILWDIATGREVRRYRGHKGGCIEIVFSPNGKVLASSSYDHTVRIWDVESGKQVYQLSDFSDPIWHLRFFPDNETLAVAPYRDGGVTVFHCPSGKKVHELPMGAGFRASAVLRHPDGRILMIEAPNENDNDEGPAGGGIQVWDVMASRVIQRFEGHHGRMPCSVLSPDGRTLASRGEDGKIRLWEMATGQERAAIEEGEAVNQTGTQILTFSPDGLTLASACRREPHVYLWDLATGQLFADFEAHTKPMYTVEYTPNGRSMFTGSMDSTILAWDMSGPNRRSRIPSGPLSDDELARHWDRLRNAPAADAYRSKWALIGDPSRAVAYLRVRFRVAETIPIDTIRGWINDLDAAKYAVREKAGRELLSHLDQTEGELRKTLEGPVSGEKRQRISRLLETALVGAPSADALREIRAVEVLEQIGSPEARLVLRDLAGSKIRTRTAREAEVSLKRLSGR